MREDLAANQGVAGVDMMSFQPENSFQVADQRLADPGHGSAIAACAIPSRFAAAVPTRVPGSSSRSNRSRKGPTFRVTP